MAKAKTLKKAQGDGDGEIGEYGTSNDSANVRLALDRSKVKWLAEDCYVFATSVPKMGESNLSVTLPQLNISQHKESLEVYTNRVRNPELTVTTLNLNNDNVYPFSYSGKPLTAIDNIHIDICLNAGGPVWTTAFRPKRGIVEVVDDRGIVAMDEYLAVGVSQLGISNVVEACAEQQHMLGELNNTDSLLQIWRLHGNYSQIRIVDKSKIPAPVKKSDDPNYVPKPKGRPRKYPRPDEPPKDATVVEQKAAEEPVAPAEPEQLEIPRYSDVRAELAYCVALEGRGAAWSAKWGPALAHDEQTLGLLAVETGDGSCLILQLPKQVGGSAGSAGSEEGVPSTPDMEGISVLSEEGVVRWEVVVLGLMVQCVAWNTHKTGQFSCGMSDGSVTVWDLNMHQPVAGSSAATRLTMPALHLVDMQHLEPQITSLAAVRSIQYCPYDANLLLLGTQDDIKIWNLLECRAPVLVKTVPTAITALAWDPHGYGIYTADCETTAVTWTPLWGSSFKPIHRKELYSHAHYYGGVWGLQACSSDEQSLLLSVASDGTVRAGYAAAMTYTKSKNAATMELCRLCSAERDGDVLRIVADGRPSVLPNGMGVQTFVTSSLLAFQCVDSVDFNTAGSAATTSATMSGAAFSAVKALQKPKKRKNMVIESDSDDYDDDFVDLISSRKGEGSGKKSDSSSSSSSAGGALPTSMLAPMKLVAYGGATGLVRVHSVDLLRTLLGDGK